ncbi:hypothetical protein AK812_SmicGene23837 [Symbiodinium microadriaticum]|uniref:Uncharacterized protein n=1 Tax=Symbiodinium microadriaticum TaxID=2951 RepID=A0A1Q9DG74_SYMMI|nr:hypothetical protein AK812_SmicGene23837 [Symbiodinium microadriaticum]
MTRYDTLSRLPSAFHNPGHRIRPVIGSARPCPQANDRAYGPPAQALSIWALSTTVLRIYLPDNSHESFQSDDVDPMQLCVIGKSDEVDPMPIS